VAAKRWFPTVVGPNSRHRALLDVAGVVDLRLKTTRAHAVSLT
jgi:hypothetical protein